MDAWPARKKRKKKKSPLHPPCRRRREHASWSSPTRGEVLHVTETAFYRTLQEHEAPTLDSSRASPCFRPFVPRRVFSLWIISIALLFVAPSLPAWPLPVSFSPGHRSVFLREVTEGERGDSSISIACAEPRSLWYPHRPAEQSSKCVHSFRMLNCFRRSRCVAGVQLQRRLHVLIRVCRHHKSFIFCLYILMMKYILVLSALLKNNLILTYAFHLISTFYATAFHRKYFT